MLAGERTLAFLVDCYVLSEYFNRLFILRKSYKSGTSDNKPSTRLVFTSYFMDNS